ncbi:hypothetical protein OG879_31545 [Streptomyces caniferus]|uniref:hypothetical protein n=1 Tax=Streptomyces caniferus TaxID=285557 RepID=UPI002E2A7976|nr:hypothetical protein [Streptomyces caniferus]
MSVVMPGYARFAATVGRPTVLVAALAMSAPGEYALALEAGWSPKVAWLMPVSVSMYAAVAAVIAANRPKGVPGRWSALLGAGVALVLALAAQVVAHLIAADYMDSSAFLVAATSAVPPVVVAHMLHLAAMPKPGTKDVAVTDQEPVAKVDTPPAMPVATPVMPVTPPATLDDVVKEETGQPDNVVDMDKPLKRSSASRGRALADIQAAVDYLTGTGQDVNGTTYGEYVGVSARTGRRDLERLGIVAA